jgi:hypothetical protein
MLVVQNKYAKTDNAPDSEVKFCRGNVLDGIQVTPELAAQARSHIRDEGAQAKFSPAL